MFVSHVSQVLQGLETYIESEKFLHTLEAVSAEWIDLSDHQHLPHKGVSPYPGSLELELQQVSCLLCAHALHAFLQAQSCVVVQGYRCKDTDGAIVCM